MSFRLELMQLQMFVAAVEEHSVRGAAERIFRTQLAASIAVRKLKDSGLTCGPFGLNLQSRSAPKDGAVT